jgi:ElaB/YqjD/DUF883 family membrane-anchored ribosome-binding protein
MEIFFKNITPEEGTTEKLLHDLRALRDDTEILFRTAGSKLAQKSKEKFLTAMERARSTCKDIQNQTVETARATDHAIHEYPYSAVGIAFGLGILLGALVLHRQPDRPQMLD